MTLPKDLRHILLYGLLLAILIFVLKWMQWKFLVVDNSIDIYVGLIAVLFTALGVWISAQVVKTKVRTVVVEKEIIVPQPEELVVNTAELEKLDLSTREYEVLQLLVQGLSNQEIADGLFLSVSTVKTHVSNLYVKLGVKNRTQAMGKAKALKIIA